MLLKWSVCSVLLVPAVWFSKTCLTGKKCVLLKLSFLWGGKFDVIIDDGAVTATV
jgi:hypothetical protein